MDCIRSRVTEKFKEQLQYRLGWLGHQNVTKTEFTVTFIATAQMDSLNQSVELQVSRADVLQILDFTLGQHT